jgi:hypothetical protein
MTSSDLEANIIQLQIDNKDNKDNFDQNIKTFNSKDLSLSDKNKNQNVLTNKKINSNSIPNSKSKSISNMNSIINKDKEKNIRNSELDLELGRNNNDNNDYNDNEKNNQIIEFNAVNLMEEMRNRNSNLNNYNDNNQYQFEEDGYHGNDHINYAHNLSEYNLSNFNSGKQINQQNHNDYRNNFQFAKTIVVEIEDDLKKNNDKSNKRNNQNLNYDKKYDERENNANKANKANNANYNNNINNHRHKGSSSTNSNLFNTNYLVAFLFINPNSGNQSGSKILEMGVKKVEFNDSDGMVYIYNMNDKENLRLGIINLKDQLDKGKILLLLFLLLFYFLFFFTLFLFFYFFI